MEDRMTKWVNVRRGLDRAKKAGQHNQGFVVITEVQWDSIWSCIDTLMNIVKIVIEEKDEQ